MAKILYCSEAGTGYAYVEGPIYASKVLRKAGHEVVLALRDLAKVERLAKGEFTVYQAPTAVVPARDQHKFPMTFADLLHNLDFGHADRMLGRVRAWRTLIEQVKPDILRSLHSPGVLLASRGLGIPTMAIGTGFLIPPPVSPLPNLRPWNKKANPEAMFAREQRTLEEFNKVLDALAAPRLGKISDLYAADVVEIWSYPELDECGPRPEAEYMGIYQPCGDAAPRWPQPAGKRVFAYLDALPELPGVLEVLRNSGWSVLALVPNLPAEVQARYAGGSLAFAPGPVDIVEAARQCDFGISHGGHNVAGAFLMAGKPQLAMPRLLPERLTAQNVVQRGAGCVASFTAAGATQGLQALRENAAAFSAKAREIAARHAGDNPEKVAAHLVDSVRRVSQRDKRVGR